MAALNGPERLAAAVAVATALAGGVPAPQPAPTPPNNFAFGTTSLPTSNAGHISIAAPYATIGRGIAK